MVKTIILCNEDSDSRAIASLLRQDQHAIDLVGSDYKTGTSDLSAYDLIILDARNGMFSRTLENCRQYRAEGLKNPMVVIMPEDDPEKEALMLNAGADDCFISGFCGPELSARIRALLRRPRDAQSSVLRIQDIEIDCTAARVKRGGEIIPLTRKEYEILSLLVRYPNKSFTPESILKRVWDSGSGSTVATVRTHMKTLRRKIGDAPEQRLIRTTRGWGYKVVDPGNTESTSETEEAQAQDVPEMAQLPAPEYSAVQY